jgi:hypothetical protein
MKKISITFALIFASLSGVAFADSGVSKRHSFRVAPMNPGRIYLRMHASVGGGLLLSETIFGNRTKRKGLSTILGLELGGFAFTRGLALHVHASLAGSPYLNSGESTTQGLLARLGAGATYHFLSDKYFVSVAVGVSGGVIRDGYGFSLGVGGQLAIGREWAISQTWNMGIQASAHYDELVGFVLLIPSSGWASVGGTLGLTFTHHGV